MGRRKRKPSGDPVDGILLLDKPEGITSNDALQQAKKLLGAQKAGHTGSLDPIATGLLPLCFGASTRWSGYFLGSDKRYRATIRLGETTETGDSEGEVVSTSEVSVTEGQLQETLRRYHPRFLHHSNPEESRRRRIKTDITFFGEARGTDTLAPA